MGSTEEQTPPPPPPGGAKPPPYKDPDDGKQRFLLELEFIQCLANPIYIHYLAQNRYFEDEAFIGYLKYLKYWQRPEYIKYIMYPHCLFFLELLQNANFRNAMAHPASKEVAHRQQYFFWKNYRNNRLKHILPRPPPEPTPVPAPAPVPATASAQAPVPAPAVPPVPAPQSSLPPMAAVGASAMQFTSPPPHRVPPPRRRRPPPVSPLRLAMSKYGTIPTSSSAPPPPPGSSPLDFISRAKARGASALATRRPWRELGDPRALSVPRGLGDAYRRARANLAHFAMNYAIVVLGVVFLSLLWHPVSLIVFLACMVAWLFLYFLRDEPLALLGRAVGEGVVLAVLSAVTLVLLLLTGATANILTSLLVGLVLVLIHALLHRPADSIDEEAGRWYTPVPPQPTY